ncbi:hypothetical protein V5O48_010899 [Marasmius crinis-equi]|uniref:HMG box domain-containing protein n=1 Tax=Marasmius crinis-equi TaxID=585013 RepID=A0ABR3F7E8_9AGAR
MRQSPVSEWRNDWPQELSGTEVIQSPPDHEHSGPDPQSATASEFEPLIFPGALDASQLSGAEQDGPLCFQNSEDWQSRSLDLTGANLIESSSALSDVESLSSPAETPVPAQSEDPQDKTTSHSPGSFESVFQVQHVHSGVRNQNSVATKPQQTDISTMEGINLDAYTPSTDDCRVFWPEKRVRHRNGYFLFRSALYKNVKSVHKNTDWTCLAPAIRDIWEQFSEEVKDVWRQRAGELFTMRQPLTYVRYIRK